MWMEKRTYLGGGGTDSTGAQTAIGITLGHGCPAVLSTATWVGSIESSRLAGDPW